MVPIHRSSDRCGRKCCFLAGRASTRPLRRRPIDARAHAAVWHRGQDAGLRRVRAGGTGGRRMFPSSNDHFDSSPWTWRRVHSSKRSQRHALRKAIIFAHRTLRRYRTQYADYVANSERSVRVSGSLPEAKNTVKRKRTAGGYQTAVIGGTRPPYHRARLAVAKPKPTSTRGWPTVPWTAFQRTIRHKLSNLRP